MFISAQSPMYQGCHWAVYDMSGKFWGYDADDSSDSDMYDYESNDMPPGCQYDSKDALLDAFVSHAPAPSPEVSSKQTAGQGSSEEELLRECRSLTCRPLAARPLPCNTEMTSPWLVAAAIFALVTGTLVIAMIFAVTIFHAQCVATAAAVKAWAAGAAYAENTNTPAASAHHVP